MTLEQAIQHCKEKAEELTDLALTLDGQQYADCAECASEHHQLAEWLTELKHLREVRALLKQRIVNTDFDMGDYYDHTQEIINKVFDAIDKVYDEVLYDAKENDK